jgi:DNA-directed RNA polymerase specialized sigma subunit
MTSKEYLEQIGKLEHAIRCMKMRSEYYDEMSLSIPGPCLDKIGTSGTRNLEAPFVKWLNKKYDLDLEIEKKEESLKNLKAEALLKIEAINNEDYKCILIERYFNRLNWDEIAAKVYVSRSTVKRWHENSLNLLKIN